MRPRRIVQRTSYALVRQCCPPRRADSHKGDYGRVLLLCGSEGFTGAAVLTANAALRSGAGLIFTGVPRSVYPIIAAQLDAPMVFPLPEEGGRLSDGALPELLRRLPQQDAVLIGPGLGRSRALDRLCVEVVRQCTCPLVVDADGINALCRHIDVLRDAACPLVLTPHEGEFRRLTQASERDRIDGAEALARQLGAVVLRKGHETVITDGRKTYVNRTGNAGLATGGSGDVLAGILVSLLGQGVPPTEAAACAAWLHGTAADICVRRGGEYGLSPADLAAVLPKLLP